VLAHLPVSPKLCAFCEAEKQKTTSGASWFWIVGGAPFVFGKSQSIAHYVSLRETWASVPLDRARKEQPAGAWFPTQQQEKKRMNITTSQIKEIRTELAKLKPAKITLDGNRSLTVKEAVFALAPTLERMKRRGFDTLEIAGKLHEKGIEVKPPTLAKYLNEFRRQQERKPDRLTPQK